MATDSEVILDRVKERPGKSPAASETAAPMPPPAGEDPGAQALAEALKSSFRVIKWLFALLVVLFFASGLFSIRPNEVGVILRFGRPVGSGPGAYLQPGFHWKFPDPIDELVRIPVGQSHRSVSTVGWYATTPEFEARQELPPPRESLIPGLDGYTLSGDGNIIHVRANLSYRFDPQDPARSVFEFTGVTNLLQNILNIALFRTSAQFTAEEALYRQKAEFREKLLERVSAQLEKHRVGLIVDTAVSEVETSAPLTIRQAFENVQSVENASYKAISDAQSRAETIRQSAIGEASLLLTEGVVQSNQVLTAIAAEATKFSDLLPDYRRNPEFFTHRMHMEAMAGVLSNAHFKIYLPVRPDGQPRELRLQINRPPEAETNAPALPGST